MIYRIRNKSGLYAKGQWPSKHDFHFSKRGKAWTSRGAFLGHLNIVSDPRSSDYVQVRDTYGDCDVVEIDVDSGRIKETPFNLWLDAYLAEKRSK